MIKVRKKLGIDYLHRKGYKGNGITVAILDTGISPHPDFEDRIVCFKDFINEKDYLYDDEGHGTHVAGIIGGSGRKSQGLLCGIAPLSNIVALKVLDNKGHGDEENVIKAIYWIIDNGYKFNIRVINISFGTTNFKSDNYHKLIKAIELLWSLGFVIVASAGNNGPGYGTVTTPGDCESVITVGADYDNVRMIINGRIKTNYSGRGPTKHSYIKPDLVAPANKIYSCCNMWNKGYPYITKSGTSMATPVVTGIIAQLLEANSRLTNYQCKKILTSTAIDLNMEKNRQGWGLVNPVEAIRRIG